MCLTLQRVIHFISAVADGVRIVAPIQLLEEWKKLKRFSSNVEFPRCCERLMVNNSSLLKRPPVQVQYTTTIRKTTASVAICYGGCQGLLLHFYADANEYVTKALDREDFNTGEVKYISHGGYMPTPTTSDLTGQQQSKQNSNTDRSQQFT
ncbi:hypothetical protein TNCV_796301 [Trichonephila clavipes]|nr:hypothetical protein TNCV_796301 [Trichonephila clavipes]